MWPHPWHTAPPQIVCPRWQAPTIQTRDTVPAIKTTCHKFWYLDHRSHPTHTMLFIAPDTPQPRLQLCPHSGTHHLHDPDPGSLLYTATTCHPNYLTLAHLPPKHQRWQSTNTITKSSPMTSITTLDKCTYISRPTACILYSIPLTAILAHSRVNHNYPRHSLRTHLHISISYNPNAAGAPLPSVQRHHAHTTYPTA